MKILVGYDGSNSAKDALVLAKKHAAAFDATVIIVSSLTGGSVTHAVEVEHATENLELDLEQQVRAGRRRESLPAERLYLLAPHHPAANHGQLQRFGARSLRGPEGTHEHTTSGVDALE